MVESAEAGAKAPVTDRGRRTRASLVEAARRVFEDVGFLEARVTDIAEVAEVAHGTFYTYFPSKEAVFREVALLVQQDFLQPAPGEEGPTDGRTLTPIARVERANRRYLEAYVRNARLMALMEQVATFSPELTAIRREMRTAFVERSARAIAHWQQQRIADPDVDPYYAANALGAMVDRFAYVWLVLGHDFEFEKAVHTLTKLWVQALKLRSRKPR